MRSAVTGPQLPLLTTRADVSFEVAGLPMRLSATGAVDRWRVLPRERRVILYRVPIERLAHLHRNDEIHRRMVIESCVFRAVAELLGKDPWDLAPERFRHL